jgi:transcriptional regulator with XRE-family HTH domain
MAFKSGITGGQISKLERDAYEPRLATLYALADALGVGPCDLIPRKH